MTLADTHIGIDPWHELTDWEKNLAFFDGPESPFASHPDFEPVYCMDCGQYVFVTYGGVCPEGTEHYIGPYPENWSHS